MTDPRGLDPDVRPDIKHEQETYPPRRYDDEDTVEEAEKRFGMSMWLGILLIGVIFLIILLLIYYA
jgi:hypothetical protein